MVRNVFALNPVDAEIERRARPGRSIFEADQGAPQAPPAPDFETLARRHQVPPNVVRALAEAAPDVAGPAVGRIGERLAAGEDVPTAVRGVVGQDDAASALLDRAITFARPQQRAPLSDEASTAAAIADNYGGRGLLKQRGQQAVKLATEVVASVPERNAISAARRDERQRAGAEEFAGRQRETLAMVEQRLADPDLNPDQRAFLERQKAALTEGVGRLEERAAQKTVPAHDRPGFGRGDEIRAASTELFGKPDPRDKSFWAAVAEGAGNLTALAAVSLATGPAALLTGAFLGSSMNQSQLYREAKEAGASDKDAQAAAQWGAAFGAFEILPISRALKLLPPRLRPKVGGRLFKRAADVAQSAGEEALQEYLATVANNLVAQNIYDPERGWDDGATESALVGAVLGAGMGAIGTAVQRGETDEADASTVPSPEGETPASRPPETPGGEEREEPPAPDPAAEAAAPTGPLGRAATEGTPEAAEAAAPEAAPEPRFPDLKPGKAVEIADPDGKLYNAVAVREDQDGVVLRIQGSEVTLTPEEFDAARDKAMSLRAPQPDDAKPDRDDDRLFPEGPAPQVEVPEGIDRDELMERANLLENERRMSRAEAEAEALRRMQEQQAIPSAQEVAEQTPDVEPVEQPEPAAAPDLSAVWDAMDETARETALRGAGYETGRGRLNAPGRKARGSAWAELSEPVRRSLRMVLPEAAGPDAAEPQPPRTPGPLAEPVRPGSAPEVGVPDAAPDRGEPQPLGEPGSSPGPAPERPPQPEEPEDAAPAAEIEAAAAEADPEPTDGQKEAGNYRMGHTRVQGMDITIENAKGSIRRKKAPDGGDEWSVEMPAHYGYFKRSQGKDGDQVDVYVGDNPDSDSAFIVNQVDPDTRKFDEHKVVLGVGTRAEAADLYERGFSDGRGRARIGSITATDTNTLKEWLKTSDTSKPSEPIQPPMGGAGARGRTAEEAEAGAAPEQSADQMLDAALDEEFGAEKPAGLAGEPEPESDAEDSKRRAWWKGLTKAQRERVIAKAGLGAAAVDAGWRSSPAAEADGYLGLDADEREAAWQNRAAAALPHEDYRRARENLETQLSALEAQRAEAESRQKETRREADADEFYRLDEEAARLRKGVRTLDHAQQYAGMGPEIGQEQAAAEPEGALSPDNVARMLREPENRENAEQLPNSREAPERGGPDTSSPSGRWDAMDAAAREALIREGTKGVTAKGALRAPYKRALEQPWADLGKAVKAHIKSLMDRPEGPPEGAPNPYPEADETGVPIADARLEEKKRQARDAGAAAGRAGEPRKAPDWMTPDLEAEWLAGYGRAKAEALVIETSVGDAVDSPRDDAERAFRDALLSSNQGEIGEWSYQIRKSRDGKTWVVEARNAGDAGPSSIQPSDGTWTRRDAIRKAIESARRRAAMQEKPDEGDAKPAADAGGEAGDGEAPAGAGADADGDVEGADAQADDLGRAEGMGGGRSVGARADDTSSLTRAEQDRLAELRSQFRRKIGSQLSAGLDPELVSIAAEMGGLYIKAGARRFRDLLRAMMEDMGLSFEQAQPYARNAYNQVRDDMDLAGESIDGMDSAADVLAEVRAMREAPDDAIFTTDEGSDEDGAADDQSTDSGEGDGSLAPPVPEDSGGAAEGVADDAGTGAGGDRPGGDAGNRNAGDVGDGGVVGGGQPDPDPLPDEGADDGVVEADPGEPSGENPGNFVITKDFPLGEGTPGQRLKANVEAIRIAKTLKAENRFATPEEQAKLARYVGWGGLSQAFSDKVKGQSNQWGRAQAQLRDLLTKQEYRAAMSSTRNAHYTSRGVVNAMWQAMRHFGFRGGRALEPTVGTGNFLGLQPEDMAAGTEWHAAELDPLTGQIAKHLYPDANIMDGIGFQDAPFVDGVFDIAIGNPPFGSETISGGRAPELEGQKVHNYIISKTAQHLRPGGVMGMVVTHRFLDTANPEARDLLRKSFRFLGAFRLPNDAFKENAGTDVVTDVIFLQKLKEGEPTPEAGAWLDTDGEIEVDGQKIRVNRYYQNNPSHILGRSAMDGTMYAGAKDRGGEYTVHADGRDVQAEINRIIAEDWARNKNTLGDQEAALEAAVAVQHTSNLAVGEMMMDEDGRVLRREMDDDQGAVITEVTESTLWGEMAEEWAEAARAAEAVRDAAQTGRMPEAVVDDMIAAGMAVAYTAKGERKSGKGVTKAEKGIFSLIDAVSDAPVRWDHDAALSEIQATVNRKRLGKARFARVKGMLTLRQKTLALINAEKTDSSRIKAMRRDLEKAYDAFVADHGFVNDPVNANAMQGDIGAELGLEAKYQPAEKGGKASAEKSAILRKRVNFPHREVTKVDTPKDGVTVSMSERGRIDLPYIARLAGQSIEEVTEALSTGDNPAIFFDPDSDTWQDAETYLSGNVRAKLDAARAAGMTENARALEAVQPEPKTKESVKPTIRGLWIPNDVFEGFLSDLGVSNPAVTILPQSGTISAQGQVNNLTEFGQQFSHADKTPLEIFASASTGKRMVIRDKLPDGKTVVNEERTKEVNALADRMAEEFSRWAYQDPDRTDAIVAAFNDKMNTHVERSFDGTKYLELVGANPEISLRDTQKNGAWRMIQSQSALMHHIVGAGKTFTAIAAVMERRRMGLSRKPMVMVPNHLVTQWARDFHALYPGANILAATPDDFTKKNRRKLFARIATGDYDAVIIGHSSMGFIEPPETDVNEVVEEQMDALQQAIADARAAEGKDSITVKNLTKRLDKYQEKLENLQDRERDDLGFDFEAMGVDYLVVDEAHEFKNLEYASAGERLVGMNDPNGSKRAFDLYTKVRGLKKRDGGVSFLTGTPVSNSLVEIYSMLKYLAHEDLRARGIEHFDAWSGAYVEAETRFEHTATQKLQPRRVMSGLVNLDSLSQIYRGVADIILDDKIREMYTEQIRAQNERDGTDLREVFPTPKVKDGGRQLLNARPTDDQTMYTDYLVARMEGMKNVSDKKEYAKIDNPLWVLTDARKASIDIRTIDPTLERDPNSKVVRAGREIKRLYDAWDDDRGTQLVFSDTSTPKKQADKGARKMIRDLLTKVVGEGQSRALMEAWQAEGRGYVEQWANAMDRAEAVIADPDTPDKTRDKLQEYIDGLEDAEATLATAESGFSVYDDLKAVLMEQGVPEDEIAFIHDYNTPDQKARLFNRMNEGKVRILLGSTPKLGAGTNVQRRLVGLHHMDAPWRPSDVEQREGRIIRQGNALYERDPDGFEVEILAYSTEGTSDVVLWQVLERKARSIEQFLKGSLDKMEEEGGDADSYADFMAASTGNPVFKLKLQTEKALTDETARISGSLMAKTNAERFLKDYDDRRARGVDMVKAANEAEIGDFRFGAETGALAELEGAIAEAKADYEEKYARYLERREKVEAERERLRAGGTPASDLPAMPTPPSRPRITSEAVASKSGFAQLLRKFLSQKETLADTEVVEAEIGDLTAKIRRRDVQVWGKSGAMKWPSYRVSLHAGDATINHQVSEASDLTKSDAVVSMFTPENLRRRLKEERAALSDALARLDKRKEDADRWAGKDVDTSRRDELRRLLEYYTEAVSLAEAQASLRRRGRSNRFIEAETKRQLGGSEQDVVTEKYEFQREGETYTGTGLGYRKGMMRDEGGEQKVLNAYEAVRKSDGRKAVVYADAKTQEAERVIVMPDEARQEIEAAEKTRESRRREAKAQATRPELSEALQAEFSRAGLSDRASLRIAETLVGIRGDTINGYQRGRLIAVALDADDPRAALDHEIIHLLRDGDVWGGEHGLFSRDEWRELVRAARANPERMRRIRDAYPDLSEAAQVEEAVAEMYADWRAGRRTKARSGLLGKIARVFDAIRRAFTGRGLDTVEQAMRAIEGGEVAARAAMRRRDSEGRFAPEGERHARPKDAAMWRDLLTKFLSGALTPRADLRVSRVPPVLRAVGVPKGALFMRAGKVRTVIREHADLPQEALMNLPELLADPEAVMRQEHRDSDVLAVTSARTGDGRPVVVAIKHRGEIGQGGEAAVVMTVYPLDDATRKLEAAHRRGETLYVRDVSSATEHKLIGANSRRGRSETSPSARAAGGKILSYEDVFNRAPGDRRRESRRIVDTVRDIPAGTAHWKAEAGDLFSSYLTDAMGGRTGSNNLLALVPGRQLFEELGKRLANSRVYLRLKEEMDALRQSWHAKTDDIAQEWIRLGRGDPEANGALMDLMHRATLAGVDPSRAFSNAGYSPEDAAERQRTHDILRAEFEKLPREFQAMFRKVSRTYGQLADESEDAIIENIKIAQDIAVKRAKRAYDREMQRIKDDGLEGDEKAEAEAAAKAKLDRAKSRVGWARQARIAELRAQFESNRLKGPYFPLARFGQYYVTLRGPDGAVESFSRFESERRQKRFAKDMEAEGWTVETGLLGAQDSDLSRHVDPQFVADVQEILADWDARPEVMDTVWQKWLETLPDQSIRTRRIHRKGRAGYSKDALRAFTHHVFHGAHQLARLKYGMQMEDALTEARREASQGSNPNRDGLVVDEMERRHKVTMNPNTAPWATWATSLAFVWYLGVSPAAAIVNLSQTTIVGIPVLKAQFRKASVSRIGNELLRASRAHLGGRGEAGQSEATTAEEKEALAEAHRRGTIDRTQAHELAGVAETGVEYSGRREWLMKKISWFFHRAEVMNREVTFLAAYRLARGEGILPEQAINVASSATWRTHFDYQNSSRPRFMQGDFPRVFLIFRQFTTNMLYRLFRDTHQSLYGADAETRREARVQLAGISMMLMAHAGITGVWGYGLLMSLLSLFFPGDDDDLEEWMHDALLMEGEGMGPAAWNFGMGMALKGVPGHALGVNLTDRIGMPNLWFRPPYRDLEGEDTVQHYVNELLGPVASIGYSMGRGIDYLSEGNWWRGAEAMVPKFANDLMQGVRYGTNGVETSRGDPVLEDVNPWEAIVQGLGFTPARVAEQYERAGRMREMEREILDRRKRIHGEAAEAVMEGRGIPRETMRKIRAFNKEHPTYPITPDTLSRSIRARRRYSAGVEDGVNLNPRLGAQIRESLAPALYQ